MDSLYQEEILEHYRHPHNRGVIQDADITQHERNATCGDELTFTFKIAQGDATSDGIVIKDVQFTGQGCAISQATASILTDELHGMNATEAQKLQKEDILDLLGIDLGPTRLKCALLSLQALKRALAQPEAQQKELKP